MLPHLSGFLLHSDHLKQVKEIETTCWDLVKGEPNRVQCVWKIFLIFLIKSSCCSRIKIEKKRIPCQSLSTTAERKTAKNGFRKLQEAIKTAKHTKWAFSELTACHFRRFSRKNCWIICNRIQLTPYELLNYVLVTCCSTRFSSIHNFTIKKKTTNGSSDWQISTWL